MSTNAPNPKPARDHLLSDKQYFILNNLAMIIFPAFGTLYFALAQTWGLPAAQQIVGTLVALDAFLGVIVKVGEASYNQSNSKFDGAINISEQDTKTIYSLDLIHDPEDLKDMDKVLFRVNPHRSSRVPDPSP